MNKRNIPSIILYVVAGLMAIYAIWSTIYSAGVISEAINTGQITVANNFYDIVSYYMGTCAQYFAFAFLLAASGLILCKKQPGVKVEKTTVTAEQSDVDDIETDEWFEEMEASGEDETTQEN